MCVVWTRIGKVARLNTVDTIPGKKLVSIVVYYELNMRKILRILICISLFCFIVYFGFIRYVRHYPIWWWFLPYERSLCDGATYSSEKGDNSLRCYFIRRSFLFRYKIEEMHRDPDLILIRQFLYDKQQLDYIIQMTRRDSEISPVYTLITDSRLEKDFMEMLDFRTSYSHEIDRVSQLDSLYASADRAAGLNVSNLDGAMNILWYVRYGHIIPHHDVYPYSDSPTDGRRFATMIIYFHEPLDGGATIFPKIGVAAKPNVGDAVLFYNTKVDNEPDPLLSHAGCPVWRGEKFIGTFWFRQFHQEFRKPCPLAGQRFHFS